MAENENKVAETARTESKETTAKTPAPKKKDKVKFTDKIKKFWRDYKSEFKKISWPSKEDTAKSTLIVIVCIVAFMIAIAILDFVFSKGLTLLSHL